MKKWYTVRDNIYGEILEFSNQTDAQMEAERRLTRHRTGYSIRRNYIQPIDAVIIENGNDILITVRPEVKDESERDN